MKLLLALLFLTSCATYAPHKVEDAAPVAIEIIKPIEVPVETLPPVVVEKHIVQVNVKLLTGFSVKQQERFNKIAKNVQAVINSEKFKTGVLNFTYKNKKQFISTTDSNELVLQNVLKTNWTLEYRLEKIAKKPFVPLTVGYTYPSVTWIVINSLIFDSYNDHDIACNIIHEFGGHKLGRYDHTQSWNKDRDYSVPYGLGSLGEKIYKEMFPIK